MKPAALLLLLLISGCWESDAAKVARFERRLASQERGIHLVPLRYADGLTDCQPFCTDGTGEGCIRWVTICPDFE